MKAALSTCPFCSSGCGLCLLGRADGNGFDTEVGGADQVIPGGFYAPGCPPRPEAILYAIAYARAWSRSR